MKKGRKIFVGTLCILCGTIILLSPAIFNGYPLMHSDSGTYLQSSADHLAPFDRPVFYGYFISATNWFHSLWSVIIFQSLILAFVLFMLMRKVFPAAQATLFPIVIAVLSFTTSLPWLTCEIMPDFFLPVTILSMGMLLLVSNSTLESMVWAALLVSSSLMHYSHLLLSTGMIFFIAVIHFFTRRKKYFPEQKLFFVALLAAVTWLIIPANNYLREKQFYISKGSGILLAGKLSEEGILQRYLNEECAEHSNALCLFKDSIPGEVPAFVWGPHAVVPKLGTLDEANITLSRIAHAAIEKHPLDFLAGGIKGTLMNLFRLNIGSQYYALGEGSNIYWKMKSFYAEEFDSWQSSGQSKGQLSFVWLNRIQAFTFATASCLLLIVLLISVQRKKRSAPQINFAWLILLAFFLSAAIVGMLSSIYDNRYQSRIAWLLPFVALCRLSELLTPQFTRTFSKKKTVSNE